MARDSGGFQPAAQDNIISANITIGGLESIKTGSAFGAQFVDNTFEDRTNEGPLPG